MRKRIGILGGISYESTVEYYKLFHKKYYAMNNNCYYPEIVIFSLDFQHFTDFEDSKDTDGYIQYIMEGIESLERAGVDFILMAANSPHAVFEQVASMCKVPMLSLVRVTAEAAKQAKLKKILLLAVSFTVNSLAYQKTCEDLGIMVTVPSARDQTDIDRIIFQELTIGVFKQESKKVLLRIIDNYEVDGVILGCTELPLVLHQQDTNKKLLDTIDIHVDSALTYALSEQHYFRNRKRSNAREP
jgi:aspartate racemase